MEVFHVFFKCCVQCGRVAVLTESESFQWTMWAEGYRRGKRTTFSECFAAASNWTNCCHSVLVIIYSLSNELDIKNCAKYNKGDCVAKENNEEENLSLYHCKCIRVHLAELQRVQDYMHSNASMSLPIRIYLNPTRLVEYPSSVSSQPTKSTKLNQSIVSF